MLFCSLLDHVECRVVAVLLNVVLGVFLLGSFKRFDIIVIDTVEYLVFNQNLIAADISFGRVALLVGNYRRLVKTVACGFDHPGVFLLTIVQRRVCQSILRLVGLERFDPRLFLRGLFARRSVKDVSLKRQRNVCLVALRYF